MHNKPPTRPVIDSGTKLVTEKKEDLFYFDCKTLMSVLTHRCLHVFLYYYTANVPSFARLIDGIQKKKSRESMVLSVVIGILLCITIW